MLGSSGFAFSEGQRAFPGWEMVKNGDWLIPRLFEQPYLRKPPGMPWAEAIASLVLGENEFSARSVSALAMTLASLLSFWFANRWFGRPWGMMAGLAHVLTPLFWVSPASPVGRSAEIEALHNLFVQALTLIAIELLVTKPKGWAGARWALALALAAAGMALVKGPAGLPCLGGAMLGGCIGLRSARALRNLWLWLGLGAACGVVGLVAFEILRRVHQLPEPPVTEPTSRFLWRNGEALGVLALPLATLITALPIGAVLPLHSGAAAPRQRRHCRARIGVVMSWQPWVDLHGHRGFKTPAIPCPLSVFWPCLTAFVPQRHFEQPAPSRPLLTRLLMDRPWAWGLGLLISRWRAWCTQRTGVLLHQRQASGHCPGKWSLRGATQVWANAIMDNRPDSSTTPVRPPVNSATRCCALGAASACRSGRLSNPATGSYPRCSKGTNLSRYEEAGLLDRM